jgi:hypothetical protein
LTTKNIAHFVERKYSKLEEKKRRLAYKRPLWAVETIVNEKSIMIERKRRAGRLKQKLNSY